MAAFEAAGDPDSFPDAGEPWQPLKLYYNHGFLEPARIAAARGDARQRGLESPVRRVAGELGARADASPSAGDHPRAVRRVLRDPRRGAASRTPPRSTRTAAGSRVPLESQQRVWPTEEYELARSLVDTTLPEDDLFAGIDP